MSLRILCGLLLSILLLASCNNEDVAAIASAGPYIPSTAPVLQAPDTHVTTTLIKTDSLSKKIKRTYKPKDVTLKEALKDLRFEPQAVRLFVSLADKTGGESYFAKNSKLVAEKIITILDKHLVEKTDVVLLIDKTGSMDDDIVNIKNSVKRIVSELKKFKNIQLGWAAYGDKNVDGDSWYEMHRLTPDLDNSLASIGSLSVTGGGDMPESVNDAIWKSVDEFNWRPNSRKMMLVLGDATSLEPPKADKSLADVIKKCIASAVNVNIYPVVISTQNIYDEIPDKPDELREATDVEPAAPKKTMAGATITPDAMVTKVYPNPTADFSNLEFNGKGPFVIQVKSLLGKTVLTEHTNQTKYSINLFSQPAGIYLVSVTNKDDGKTEVRQVVKK